jgi:hypothetical protein
LAAIIGSVMSAIMEVIGALVQTIAKIVEGLFKGLMEVAKALGEVLFGLGKALFSGLESLGGLVNSFLSNLSMPSLPSINLEFVTHAFGRKVNVKIIQINAAELLKDEGISLTMQRLKITQPQQSLMTVLYVGSKAGAKAGYKTYERTGNLNKSIEVARN